MEQQQSKDNSESKQILDMMTKFIDSQVQGKTEKLSSKLEEQETKIKAQQFLIDSKEKENRELKLKCEEQETKTSFLNSQIETLKREHKQSILEIQNLIDEIKKADEAQKSRIETLESSIKMIMNADSKEKREFVINGMKETWALYFQVFDKKKGDKKENKN